MRLPRRSPYYGHVGDELAYVHEGLYSNSLDQSSVESALGVVRLWMHRGSCPQAVESTALLVQSIVSDQAHASDYAARALYAMALTRFVNSVVDSFQTGAFAQSIGAIAERIGLPQWLVQVRHSATHEDLPSKSVCRTACERALAWLDQHYWKPTLYAHDDTLEDPAAPDDTATVRAAQLVYAYRKHATAVLRDASLAQRSAPPHLHALSDIEQWVRDACQQQRQPSSTAARLGRDAQNTDNEIQHQDVAPILTVLVSQLLLPGALFPADLKRRRTWHVPDEAAQVWDPLLWRMHHISSLFLPMLSDALVQASTSFGSYVRGWLEHLSHFDVGVPSDVRQGVLQRRFAPHVMPLSRVIVYSALNASRSDEDDMHHLAKTIYQADADEAWRQSIAELCRVRTISTEGVEIPASACLAEMETRAVAPLDVPAQRAQLTNDDEDAPTGWRRAPRSYTPTPIGCLQGQRPPLLLLNHS